MNVEAQLQVAYSTNAELRDQIDVLNRTIWSLEERLRISDESREDLKRFYENQMDALRADQQKLIDAAVAQITKSFEEQISKLIAERDAALLSARRWRGKKYDVAQNAMPAVRMTRTVTRARTASRRRPTS